MLTTLRKKFAVVAATLLLAVVPAVAIPAAVSVSAQESIENSLKCGSNLDATGSGCNTNVDTGTTRINDIVKDIINIFSVIVGIVSVIMIIWGGFKYITSGGDSGNVTSAKNTIIYAVIGLVIVALAQFIVQFVLGKVAG